MNYFCHKHNKLLILEMAFVKKTAARLFSFNVQVCAGPHQSEEMRWACPDPDDGIAFGNAQEGIRAR